MAKKMDSSIGDQLDALPRPPIPHPGPQTKFLESNADIAIYGGQAGGGKTWALLAEALRHIENPEFGAVIFRRTSPQITNEGGLWDESMTLYPPYKGTPRHTLDWKFPSHANIGFRHLQYETDKLAWQGAQIALLGFDELTHFSETQFFYLLSRNRSTCGVRPYVRATTNPTPSDDPIGGWVNRLVSWWIDQATGLAIPERSGIERWFIRRHGELIWSDSKLDLIERYGRPDLDEYHSDQTALPKSLTFIPAKLSDNPTLLKQDPSYRANLLALPEVERQQLAEGNWNAKLLSGLFFKVAKIEIVYALPTTLRYCRAWDLAATDGAGDWTVGAKLGVDTDGVFYIADVQRGQWESSYRDQVIRQTAVIDEPCQIRLPQDPAAAGKSEAKRMVVMLTGHEVKTVVVSGQKSTRAVGLASQMNVGNVKMLSGPWNQGLLQRLDAFPTKGVPDDEVDALADAFNELASKKRVIVVATGS
jgi:predicted phage terminase large subunit-like protein